MKHRTFSSGFAAKNDFAVNLLLEELHCHPDKDVVISPVGTAIALAMTMNGARNETRAGIGATLSYKPGKSMRGVNESFLALQSSLLKTEGEVELSLANAIWTNLSLEPKKLFLQKARQFYGAKIAALDFTKTEAALNAMNDWVKQSTQGRIPGIITSIPNPDAVVMFIMNAIHFKAQWTLAFDTRLTREMPFYGPHPEPTAAKFMVRNGQVDYLESESFQAVRLPYGRSGNRYSMTIFLPKIAGCMAHDKFMQALTGKNLSGWFARFKAKEGRLVLPRFKVEYDTSLNETLKALGMETAFDEQKADFSSLFDSDTDGSKAHISDFRHRSFIEVNEAGTEAASVSSVGIARTSSIDSNSVFDMQVDRPFYFFVRDEAAGNDNILFAGHIVNPS